MDSSDENLLPNQSQRILILCDFDGTVSTKDTVNRLVREHLISPEWRYHVKRYLRGDIGSREVYKELAPFMSMTQEQLERFVCDHAALDPDFPTFLKWAKELGLDVKIVSDGFDRTIETLFRNHSIEDIDIFANNLSLDQNGKVEMHSPFSDPECGTCGTCKLQIINKFRPFYDTIILIGDGESDRHAASEADFVIALKDLFVYCAARGIPALRADGFGEIPRLLSRRIRAVAFDMDGTLVNSLDSLTEAFNHMFMKLGYPKMTPEEVARTTSMSLMDFVKSFLKPEEVETGIRVFREFYDEIFLERTIPVAGALETLNALNGTIQGIVTNKRGKYARLLAEHLGFSKYMACIIGAEDGFRAKPSGDMFNEFMRSMGIDKDSTIYVGDAPVDIQAAKNAGIDAFVIAGPIYSAEELALHKPRRVLNAITELPASLKPIINRGQEL